MTIFQLKNEIVEIATKFSRTNSQAPAWEFTIREVPASR